MIAAVLSFAGAGLMFYGYDQACMSEVNINPDYLRVMNADPATNTGEGRLGGLVSFWFLGCLVGKS
jgi:hypothetical protein